MHLLSGTKPWTPQTGWDKNSAKAYICGKGESKEIMQQKKRYKTPCTNMQKNWFGNDADANDMSDDDMPGTHLIISKEGVYDVYFVKYNGLSEYWKGALISSCASSA